MSGHSKWSQIKHAKGANDAKRGALFTRLSKNVSLAAKHGKDPEMNPALRAAIDAAKDANMPKDNIERAVLRGAGELPGQTIEELTYEGYGPSGVALMIRCATDNTNRTASFIKSTLNKYSGNLGGPGTVQYLFERRGVLRTSDTTDATQLAAMDAGADDIVEEDGGLSIYTQPELLEAVKSALKNSIEYSSVDMVPITEAVVEDKDRTTLETLLELLEDNEDVIELYHNAKL